MASSSNFQQEALSWSHFLVNLSDKGKRACKLFSGIGMRNETKRNGKKLNEIKKQGKNETEIKMIQNKTKRKRKRIKMI